MWNITFDLEGNILNITKDKEKKVSRVLKLVKIKYILV